MSSSFAREVQIRLREEGIDATIQIIKMICEEEFSEGALTEIESIGVEVVLNMLIRNFGRTNLQ
jgi:hypothetical protein